MGKVNSILELFPACAGVILSKKIEKDARVAVPRMCGGDPSKEFDVLQYAFCSPHVRG